MSNMITNTNYSIYNGYNTLFGTSQAGSSNSMSNLLFKINDYSNSIGYNLNKGGYVSSSVQTYLSDIKTGADNLKSAFSALFGTGTNKVSVFEETSLSSSDKEAVTVQTSGAYKGGFEGSSISIQQVAASQQNAGTALSSSGKSFQTGWNQIEIQVGDKTHQISFEVKSSDDNAAVMKTIANRINEKNIGITASVSTDNGQKTSALTLEGNVTGVDPKQRFEVRDLANGGGGAASILGIDTVTREAQNALYRVNGGELIESKTNNVTLADGVTATLRKATSEPVTFNEEKDPNAAINKVREMVNGFNGLLAAADDNRNDRGGARLFNQLTGLSSAYGASLSRIGINVSSEGYLSIDTDKMQKAAESGELEKFFQDPGTSYGFANRLSRIADDVSRNPVDYIGKDKIQSSPTAGNSQMFSYLQMHRYQSLMNTGLLLDYLI